MNTILINIAILLVLLIFYCFYQLKRNSEVYRIKKRWLDNGDIDRCKRHPYDFMMDPSKHNNYGLKWPDEDDYL